MTARKTSDAESDNSGVATGSTEAKLLEHIRKRGGATIDGLAKRTGLRQSEIRQLVESLHDADLVTINCGLQAVYVEPTDEGDLITDGGVTRTLLSVFGGDDTQQIPLAEDEVFEITSNERRRRLLRLFGGVYDPDRETYLRARDLADVLARVQSDGETVTRPERRREYVSLIQTHLPLLDEYGVVEYYEGVKKVRVTDTAVVLADFVESGSEICAGPAERQDSVLDHYSGVEGETDD